MLCAALTRKDHSPAGSPLFRARAADDAFLGFRLGKQALFRRGIARGDGGGRGDHIRAIVRGRRGSFIEHIRNNQQAGQQGEGRDITPPPSSRRAIIAEIARKPVLARFKHIAALGTEVCLVEDVGHNRIGKFMGWRGQYNRNILDSRIPPSYYYRALPRK
jgi:hypothetical protein